jgi:hypothetical protein
MKRLIAFASVVLGLAGAAHSQILTGNILGTVKDESGALLPGVTATLSSATLPAVTVVTDERGEYRFTELVPGAYSLTITLTGFATYKEDGLRVAVSGTTERNVVLKVSTLEETITVSGESPMVDPRKVGMTANLTREVLELVPTLRFGYYEFVKWAPGVASSDPGGTGGSSSVLGSATNENIFYYEGVNGNSPSSGESYSGGLNNAVEEVQVSTLGASAEYQVAQGAVFNAVLKSGTNSFRGDATGFFYPDKLISKPIKLPCNCSYGQTGYTLVQRLDYSATLGGPIMRDKLWFFGAWIYTRRKERNPGIDPDLPYAAWNNALVGKATWQLNERWRFQGMFQAKPWYLPSLPTISRPYEATTLAGGNNLMYSEEITATLTQNTLVMARATGWMGKGPNGPNYLAPLNGDFRTPYRIDSRTGVACCGVQNFGESPLSSHSQSVKVNKYIQRGRSTHDVRFGAQFAQMGISESRTLPGGVNYSDLGGLPDQATFRDPYVSGAQSRSWGIWAEDQLTFGSRLTINLGIRYDSMNAISPDLAAINTLGEETGQTVDGLGDMFTWSSTAPRVGFNVKLTEDGKTVLRGNYGRASRVIFLNEFNLVHPGLSPVTLARWNPATSSYSTIISVTDSKANLRVDPDSEAPFTDSVSIGVDRELRANLGVGATYVYKYGKNQVGWQDIGGTYGTRAEVLPDGRTITVFPLLSPTSTRIYQRTNGPGTFNRYHGLVLTLDKRLSQRWQANISYTRSKAEGLTTTAQDPNGSIFNDGLLDTDRPHLFVVVSSFLIPRIETQLSATLQSVSGNPFAPQAQVQLPQGRLSVNIERADGTYSLPRQDLLNFRLTKSLFQQGPRRLELAAEVANVLQNKAAQSIVTRNLFATTFNQPSTWVLPRRMWFSAAYKF